MSLRAIAFLFLCVGLIGCDAAPPGDRRPTNDVEDWLMNPANPASPISPFNPINQW